MEIWNIILTAALSSTLASTLATLLFTSRIERQLDIHRAYLQRFSKIHELQVGALIELYAFMHRTHELLRKLLAPVEKRDERDSAFIKSFTEAKSHATRHRLLLPPALADSVDRFFQQLDDARIDLAIAFDPEAPSGHERKEVFDKFKQQAFDDIPKLLKSIESEARSLIYDHK